MKKELKETNQMLLEKLALISDLDGKIRQLTQENQDLGTRVNQYLTQYGQMATKPQTTVVQGSPGVQPVVQPITTVAAQTRSIALNGQVTAVDLPQPPAGDLHRDGRRRPQGHDLPRHPRRPVRRGYPDHGGLAG